jgi:nitrite reductase (cytochrome c-552)
MKRSIPMYIAVGMIVLLAAALIGVLLFMKSQPAPMRGIPPMVEIAEFEPDSELWGLNFPNQYGTMLLTTTNNTRTPFGGSLPFSKLEEDPRLLVLFAGMGFSKEYNEDRGHGNALYDVEHIERINEKSPATCYSCKSADMPRKWQEMGLDGFGKVLFKDMSAHMQNSIGCANCHEANTMRLIVTNPALDNAMKAQGRDWTTFTRQEMRTVVCANCHVEYYFKDGTLLVFPWDNGTNVDQISTYYAARPDFKDWVHPDSGAPMIKMQHPEYELYTSGSTHWNAGVACADCHMPYTRDGAAKFSTHDVKSPLLNAQTACGACHTNVDFVVERVSIIQKQVHATMMACEDAIVEAIAAIKSASEQSNVDAGMLEEARWLHRESQLRWDYIAAENSMGFHNPSESLRILAAATNLARQAQIKAMQAVQ